MKNNIPSHFSKLIIAQKMFQLTKLIEFPLVTPDINTKITFSSSKGMRMRMKNII